MIFPSASRVRWIVASATGSMASEQLETSCALWSGWQERVGQTRPQLPAVLDERSQKNQGKTPESISNQLVEAIQPEIGSALAFSGDI